MSGDNGTGKTHLSIGLGTEVARDGFKSRYALATTLVSEFVKTIAHYGPVDLLCIDALGYMQLDARASRNDAT